MDISMVATLLKRLVAVCLAFVIFWHVTQHPASRRGKAIVHVSHPDVLVLLDHLEYRVRSVAESPIVCDLSPGNHRIQVWRHGVMLDEETFVIESGKDVVVSVPDRADTAATATVTTSGRPAPTAKTIGPDGLAVHIRRPGSRAVPN